jgi:hypothetical protein
MDKSCIRIAEIEEGHGPPWPGIWAVLLHPMSFELDGGGGGGSGVFQSTQAVDEEFGV